MNAWLAIQHPSRRALEPDVSHVVLVVDRGLASKKLDVIRLDQGTLAKLVADGATYLHTLLTKK